MRKHLLLVFLLTFASLTFINLGADKAYAATGEWLNQANIKVGADIYTDSNPYDPNLSFRLSGETGNCVPRIENFSTDNINDASRLGSATLKLFPQDASGACPEQSDPITLSDTANSGAIFSWKDAGNIEYAVDGLNFTLFSGNTFSADTNSECKSTLEVTGDTTGNYIPRFNLDGCSEKLGTFPVQIANPTARETAAGTGTSQVGTSAAGIAGSTESCEEVGGAFGPIMCPLLNQLDDAFGWIDEKISDALTVKEAYYKGQCTNGGTTCTEDQRRNPVKAAWANVRNVAYILLIPIMLIMVIGTALGFGFVDAYTVKRAMPRLLVAIIFITLSYNICVIMIDVFNAVGKGIGGLVAVPFGGSDNLTINRIFSGAGSGEAVAGTAILAGLTWGAVSSAAIVGLLATFIAPIVLILVIIYALLLIRELLLIFAIIFAPLAILSWIFPGNDKLWKLWWGTFSKMLYIFPIIMGFIMVGRGFASMVNAVDDGGVTITILKGLAFVGPYFFIPKAFQMAGGAFASISGMANDRGRGVFDRAKKKRGATLAQRGHDLKTGNANNFLARKTGMTNIGKRVGVGAKGGFGFGARGAAARDSVDMMEGDKMANTEEFKAQQENDNINRAAASGTSVAEAKQNMYDTFYADRVAAGNMTEESARAEVAGHVRAAQGTIGLGRRQQIASAKQLVKTNTGYSNLKQMTRTLGIASGGNENTANQLAGFANATTKQVGRSDMAPGYTNLSRMVNQERLQSGSVGQDAYDAAHDNALDSQGIGAIIGGKADAVREILPAMERRIDIASANVDNAYSLPTGTPAQNTQRQVAITSAEREFKQVMASTSSAIDIAGNISPEAGRIMANSIHNRPNIVQGQTTSVQARIEHLRSDPEFAQMHREYQQQQNGQVAAAQAAQAAAAAAQQPPGGVPPNPGGGGTASDLRLKQNVVLHKATVDGTKIYSFNYLLEEQTYVGVIAQEILKSTPTAVYLDEFGYYKVNYSMLGLRMVTLEEYKSDPESIYIKIVKEFSYKNS